MYKGKPQLIIMLVRPSDHLSNTVHGWRHAHYFVCSIVCSHWHSRSSISGLEKRVIRSSDKYMQSLPPGKLQVCQLIQNKVNQDLPRAKKIRELLSCLNSKVEFKISFKPTLHHIFTCIYLKPACKNQQHYRPTMELIIQITNELIMLE